MFCRRPIVFLFFFVYFVGWSTKRRSRTVPRSLVDLSPSFNTNPPLLVMLSLRRDLLVFPREEFIGQGVVMFSTEEDRIQPAGHVTR